MPQPLPLVTARYGTALALILFLTLFCFAADANEPRYAGAEVCSSCHQDIAASQANTAMARTWHGATTSLLPVNYNGRALGSEVRRQGDRFIYSAGTPDGSNVSLPVKVMIGGERNGLSFLASIETLGGMPLERAALIETRYCYNTPHHELALSPGFPSEMPRSYETALGRVLSPTFEVKCLTCHGRPNTLGAGKQGGVRCESCHGPGLQHVQAVGHGKPGTGIINPRKLTSEQSLEICAQCHNGFSYQSDPLPKELLVSSQVPALRNSECFIQTGGALTCTRCHSPHRDAPHGELEKVSVNVCLSCHSAAVEHRAAICPVNAGDKCISCHMPLVNVGAFHTTDHWIRVHPEQAITPPKHDDSLRSQIHPLRECLRIIVTDDGAKAEAAVRRLANGDAFFDVAHDLSADATAPGGGYAGEMTLSQMDPKVGVAAAKLGHGETSGIIDMGNRWIIVQRMPRDFKLEADQLFQQATDLKLHGDAKGALEKDQQALKIYPNFLRALTFMGVTLGENGAVQKGSEVLGFAAGLYPKDSTTQFDLGLTLSSPANRAGQIEAFRRAVDLDRDNVAVYENLGAALYSAGDWQNAIEACRQGLQVDPLSAKLYYNLSMMLAEHADTQGSERARALATKIDPEILPRR